VGLRLLWLELSVAKAWHHTRCPAARGTIKIAGSNCTCQSAAQIGLRRAGSKRVRLPAL